MYKRLNNLRIWLILLAFLGTVGVLFGGQKLAAKFQIENPVRNTIKAIKSVKDFQIKEISNGLIVELKIGKVGNLETVLDLVKHKVEQYYEQPVRYFNISGLPDEKLQQVRYDLSFYLEEALVSGSYTQLKQALESYQPIKAKVYLGTDFIYIQLENNTHYLYEAIPRRSKIVSVNNNQGGDSV